MVEIVAGLEEHLERAVPRRRRREQLEGRAVLTTRGQSLGERPSRSRGEGGIDAIEKELLPQGMRSQTTPIVDGDERQRGEALAIER
jgi:hypothetical protein